MAPGPLTTSHRGGFGFANRTFQYHGGGFGRIAPPIVNRLAPAPQHRLLGAGPAYHGKFSVETNEDGSLVITPGDDERIVGVGVEVEPLVGEPEIENGGNGNGMPEEASRRSLGRFSRRSVPLGTRQDMPRRVDKLSIS